MTTTTKVVLRKKAPFFCRATIQGKPSCLKPLAETDGDLCAPCAEAKKLALEKPIQREVVPAEAVTESQAQREAEWQDRLARGPIWPI